MSTPKKKPSEFGRLLRTFRKRANLTQEALAELVPTTFQTVSNYERGFSRPDPDMVKVLVRVLKERKGIGTAEEANELLGSEGYAPLSKVEVEEIWRVKPSGASDSVGVSEGEEKSWPTDPMDALHQAYDQELALFFTNAEELRALFKRLISAERLLKRIFVIHGVGGVGKSSLLSMFRLHAQEQSVPVALVSASDVKSPIELLEAWVRALLSAEVRFPQFIRMFTLYRSVQARYGINRGGEPQQTVEWNSLRGESDKVEFDLLQDPIRLLTQAFLADLRTTNPARRLVLMLDTFEQLSAFGEWCGSLVQQLPRHILVVIAGRAAPTWTHWPAWLREAEVHEIKPMGRDDVKSLIRSYYQVVHGEEPTEEQIRAIIHFARGLPIAVTSSVDLCILYRYDVTELEAIKPRVTADLVDRLLAGVAQSLVPTLEAAAVLRWFDRDLLRVLIGNEVQGHYDELRRFAFVRPRVSGMALHDTVRDLIDLNLLLHERVRYQSLHLRASQYFEELASNVAAEQSQRFELESLYHLVCADERVGIARFQEQAERFVRYHLLHRLRALLNDLNGYEHRLEAENSGLWLMYYKARLAFDEGRFVEAETLYQTIGENGEAEAKLRAYTLCDLAEILVKDEWLGQTGGRDRAMRVVEAARQAVDFYKIDAKLVFIFTHLSRIDGLEGKWQEAIYALQSQLEFFQQQDDAVGIVKTLAEIRWTYGRWGNWRKSFDAARQAAEITESIPGNSFLKAKLTEFSWIPLWAGRYRETEKLIREGLAYAAKVDDFHRQTDLSMMLAYTLGLQKQFQAALLQFDEVLKRIEDGQIYDEGVTKGFLGNILARQGEFDKAESNLKDALIAKQKGHDIAGIPELCNWLGELFETRGDWGQAILNYQESLDLHSLGRRHFECGALVGLVRIGFAQNDANTSELLTEAKALAEEYEYNDYLALIALIEAVRAWDGADSLHYFQLAMIYALRYNRFLLDEVLSSRPQRTPFTSITSFLRAQGDKGRQMLSSLREWWLTGANDTGTPRPDTISPIPEGISLLEAEERARAREPGDGSRQDRVIEQINLALGTMGQWGGWE